jgi:hypothetical protein
LKSWIQSAEFVERKCERETITPRAGLFYVSIIISLLEIVITEVVLLFQSIIRWCRFPSYNDCARIVSQRSLRVTCCERTHVLYTKRILVSQQLVHFYLKPLETKNGHLHIALCAHKLEKYRTIFGNCCRFWKLVSFCWLLL